MSPAPFVDRPDAVWFHCGDCDKTYDGRLGHVCDDDPLAPAKGTFLPFLIGLVVYLLILVALDAKFGWPVR